MPTSPKRTAKSPAKRGIFLTFEGGEGTGKTTQIELLRKVLEANGRRVLITREPGGTPIADRIRAMILDPSMHGLDSLAELFLYEASRAQHVAEKVRPALAAGQVVLCDRFADSSVVYQGAARGIDAKLVQQLNRIATGGLQPHRTILLDLDPKLGLARAGRRGQLDRLERETIDFHRAVRAGYLKLARTQVKRVRLVDASGDAGKVHQQVLAALRGLLP